MAGGGWRVADGDVQTGFAASLAGSIFQARIRYPVELPSAQIGSWWACG
ncbi:hypothetical protein ACFWAY_47490 [Rhodococcus sp. NPDC059968]